MSSFLSASQILLTPKTQSAIQILLTPKTQAAYNPLALKTLLEHSKSFLRPQPNFGADWL
jgi:hypothetical protein